MAGAAKPAIRVFYPHPSFFVQSFGPLRPVAHLSSFGFCARPILSSCFLRSVFWLVPSCRTSFFFRLLGSLRPVFEFLVFLLAVCRAVPRGNVLGEMTQCGASSIAAHCIVHRSALRLALQRSAFVACPFCYHRRSRFHEEIHRAGLFPDNCFGIHSNPFLPSFQFPSSRVSILFSQSFCLLCPFSTAASLSSSIPFFPSAQVSFPLISTTFVRMKYLSSG